MVSNELIRSAVVGVSQVLSDRIAIDVARFCGFGVHQRHGRYDQHHRAC